MAVLQLVILENLTLKIQKRWDGQKMVIWEGYLPLSTGAEFYSTGLFDCRALRSRGARILIPVEGSKAAFNFESCSKVDLGKKNKIHCGSFYTPAQKTTIGNSQNGGLVDDLSFPLECGCLLPWKLTWQWKTTILNKETHTSSNDCFFPLSCECSRGVFIGRSWGVMHLFSYSVDR